MAVIEVDIGSVVRALDAGARRLHDPSLREDEIVARLEAAVVSMGLAQRAHFVPGLDAQGNGAACTPVHQPDGSLVGVLRYEGVPEGALPFVQFLASQAELALGALARIDESRKREASSRHVAERLQDTLLPPIPDVPHTHIDVAYRAATADARVGGDFYDVFPLPSGRVLITLGDVVGKGIEAAGRTAQITQTLRALAMQDMELDTLLERVDQQVTYQDPEIMATVWCGIYEPLSGELAFASLGHPPALLLREEGEPIRLTLQGLPLGMRDLIPEPPEVRTRLLTSRDLLVLYTDGVVETSGDLGAGMDALIAAVGAYREEPLSKLIDGTLDRMLIEADHRDDAAMLLLRRR